MGEAAGQVLSYGVGVALSPLPIVAVVLMLATPKGRVNGPAFILGWVFGLAVAGMIVLMVAGGADMSDPGEPSSGNSYLKIALGVLLLGLAARQFRGRPQGDDQAELPAWMKTLDNFNAVKAAGAAVLPAAVNPKNLILIVGAAMAISQTNSSTGAEAGALALFVVIGTIGPAIPVVIYFFMRDRADAILGHLKAWMTRQNATIIAVICLIIGAKLIGDAVSSLSA